MTNIEAWESGLCFICHKKCNDNVSYAHHLCWEATSAARQSEIILEVEVHTGGGYEKWGAMFSKRVDESPAPAPKPGPPSDPMSGVMEAAERRFRELTDSKALLLTALEESLSHMNDVAPYLARERNMSQKHGAVIKRIAAAIRDGRK